MYKCFWLGFPFAVQQPTSSGQATLLDLFDSTTEAAPPPSSTATGEGALLDLLDLSSQPAPTAPPLSLGGAGADLGMGGLMNLLGTPVEQPVTSAQGLALCMYYHKELLQTFARKMFQVL